MKNLIIWYHRRRAAFHGSQLAHKREQGYGAFRNPKWNEFYQIWHLEQIKRLESNGDK